MLSYSLSVYKGSEIQTYSNTGHKYLSHEFNVLAFIVVISLLQKEFKIPKNVKQGNS